MEEMDIENLEAEVRFILTEKDKIIREMQYKIARLKKDNDELQRLVEEQTSCTSREKNYEQAYFEVVHQNELLRAILKEVL